MKLPEQIEDKLLKTRQSPYVSEGMKRKRNKTFKIKIARLCGYSRSFNSNNGWCLKNHRSR
jgi:hypothetical protein